MKPDKFTSAQAGLMLHEHVMKVADFMNDTNEIGEARWTYATHWTRHEKPAPGAFRNDAYLRSGDLEISFSYDWSNHPDRLRIYGMMPCWPAEQGFKQYSYYSSDPLKEQNVDSITVKWDTEPKKVASAIRSRVLPGYKVLFEHAKSEIQKSLDRQRVKNQRIEALCGLMGERMREEWRREDCYPQIGWSQDMTVRALGSSFELSKVEIGTFEQLKKIVDFIRKVTGKHPPELCECGYQKGHVGRCLSS